MKALLALGIVVVLGFRVSDPLYDAAARSICAPYAAEQGLVLVEARGAPPGRLGFASFPNYSCDFSDSSGHTVFVDENDDLIEPTLTYRGWRIAGWLAWISAIVAGVALAWNLGLLKRD
ncbi:MAG TPA: hypothetical protein VFZ75_12100 [Actinomycetota bacterium]|nr:hypothetical protein [Actinomycetota bacterium]